VDEDDPDAAALKALAGLFGAEDLQLYYQVAVQARSEIGLAPDEYAGFTMALLRMLAFAPVRSRTRRVRSAPRQAHRRGRRRPAGATSAAREPAARRRAT
jgi:DNA polymerase-3 subunit gamma/tau